MGFSVLRLRSRDAVVAAYTDSFEGEPLGWYFWLLDATAGRVIRLDAWSVQFTADEEELVYGRADALTSPDEVTGRGPDRSAETAKRLGLPLKRIERASYEDGFVGAKSVLRPVVLNMASGKERTLAVVGGGTLALFSGQIVGLPRPHYYEFPDWREREPAAPERLDLRTGQWLPLATSAQKSALDALEQWQPFPESCEAEATISLGDVILTTRDRSLGLVVVESSGDGTVRPARLRRGWSGHALCEP